MSNSEKAYYFHGTASAYFMQLLGCMHAVEHLVDNYQVTTTTHALESKRVIHVSYLLATNSYTSSNSFGKHSWLVNYWIACNYLLPISF